MENEIIYSNDDFYISYLQHPSEFAQALDATIALALGNDLPPVRDETALCIHDTNRTFGIRFLILYGDHREAYKAIAEQGLDACMNYFNHNLDQMGHSSDKPPGTNH